MKILLCHNFYQQQGGEYQVFRDEAGLLRSRGHDVIEYTRDNDEINHMGRVSLVRKTIWNTDTTRDLAKLIQAHEPDVMHCTNTFPLISPSAYSAARRAGVRVVQSLHNFRLICAGATLLRNRRVCEDCIGKRIAWPAIAHRCYRGNLGATATLVAFQAIHQFLNTWQDVDVFVALSNFSRDKLIEGGLPADKIVVKPNFIEPDPLPGPGDGGFVLFVGRLAEEKGIHVLLDSWKRLNHPIQLRIVGDGPLDALVAAAANADSRISWLGRLSHDEVYEIVGKATALVVPSIWYEVCPKTILEALARGTPVITSAIGGMLELVAHGETGMHFRVGDADHLAETIAEFHADADQIRRQRAAARFMFETHYGADQNYATLMRIYQDG